MSMEKHTVGKRENTDNVQHDTSMMIVIGGLFDEDDDDDNMVCVVLYENHSQHTLYDKICITIRHAVAILCQL